MLVLIPVLFLIIVTLVVFWFVNDDFKQSVKQTGSALPVLSSFIEGEDQIARENLEERIQELEAENAQSLRTIETMEFTIGELEEEILRIESEEDDDVDVDSISDSQDEKSDLSEIVRTLENMTASKAAAIMSEIDQDEAVIYLKVMRTSNRSNILARMNPEEAAQLVSLMKN